MKNTTITAWKNKAKTLYSHLSSHNLLEDEVLTRIPLLLLTKFTLTLAPSVLILSGSAQQHRFVNVSEFQ